MATPEDLQDLADKIGFEASQCRTMDGSALLLALQAWVNGISPCERLCDIADQYQRK